MTERNIGKAPSPAQNREQKQAPWIIPSGGIVVGEEEWSRPETRMRTPRLSPQELSSASTLPSNPHVIYKRD